MPDSNGERSHKQELPPLPGTAGSEQDTTANDVQRKPLRLWPAAVILALAVGLIALIRFRAGDDAAMATMPLVMGPIATAPLLILWWLLGSALAWRTRIIGVVVVLAMFGILFFASHPTMQMLIVLMCVPIPIILCAVWAILARNWTGTTQVRGAAVIMLVSVAIALSLRFDGMYGNGVFSVAFRWSPTFDDRAAVFLDRVSASDSETSRSAERLIASALDWPEFRGSKRDGIVRDTQIRTDWDANPLTLLWKHPVGLGWSSFAVVGDFAFTQEQRRDDEVVVCYDTDTGRQIWTHADATRFSESMGGDGPRATPTFHDGKVFALGANGLLNCLDATSGERIWSTNILGDGSIENLTWGMAGSPLVANDLVVVNAGGSNGQGLLAYDRASGTQVWSGGSDKAAYSSPHFAVLSGMKQVLIFDQSGLAGHDVNTGVELWKFDCPPLMANNCLQPHLLNESDILVGATMTGTIRLSVESDSDGWTVTKRWTSRSLKLNFNDFVVKDGYAYGLDQGILACIDLDDGKRAWKGGRYGYGQVLLMDEDNMLLIVSEKGEVVLVEASPESHHEIARFHAIEGKTWNHPVVANGKLFVRNGEEAACYDISAVGR